MPSLRVTQSTVSSSVLAGLQTNLDRMQTLQSRLSSGKQVSRPSDSPAGVLDAMRLRSASTRNDQYSRNADDALGWLGTADNALTSSLDLVRRARDLVLGSANAAAGDEARRATAQELRVLRDGLLQVANTRYIDRFVFAGTAAPSAAFDVVNGAYQYQGDTNAVRRSVGDGDPVQVNLTGSDVFVVGAGDAFTILTTLADQIEAGQVDTASTTGLTALDAVRTQIQDKLSIIGARYHQVETMQSRADDTKLTLTSMLSEVEDIDLPKTISELSMQQVAYQAALAAGARAIQPSLVDFLR